MILLGNQFVPLSTALDRVVKNGIVGLIVMYLSLLLMIPCIIAKVAIHAILLKKYGGIKVNYGINKSFVYVGSTAYFSKKHCTIIVLSPVVLLGGALLILNVVLQKEWFWFIYYMQITNISTSAASYHAFYFINKMPEDVLIQVLGLSMKMYSKSKIM